MMRAVELLQSVPVLLSLLLILSLMGKQNELTIALVIGVTGWFALSRIVRSEVRQIRNSEYVLYARCTGGSFLYVMWRHLIPNVLSAVMFAVVSNISTCITMESTLSFLGLGVRPPAPSWGNMLVAAQNMAVLKNQWWMWIPAGAAVVLMVLAINFLGDGLRDAWTPEISSKGEETMEEILKVNHLNVVFDDISGPLTAVYDVNFGLRRGEILGIIGESGSGKSVTARSIIQLAR